jgi:hypothetical protein
MSSAVLRSGAAALGATVVKYQEMLMDNGK